MTDALDKARQEMSELVEDEQAHDTIIALRQEIDAANQRIAELEYIGSDHSISLGIIDEQKQRIAELEAELNHFRDPVMRPSQRYWEGRWRDAEAANKEARRAGWMAAQKAAAHTVATWHQNQTSQFLVPNVLTAIAQMPYQEPR